MCVFFIGYYIDRVRARLSRATLAPLLALLLSRAKLNF